jgi:hypothetical protein
LLAYFSVQFFDESSGEPRGGSHAIYKPRYWGSPHSNKPETSMKVELRVGVTQSGRSPEISEIWIPMKEDPKGNEAKGRGLGKHQAQ